jgi:RNA polymerase sigma-70 factor (ECF subfamily)
MAEDSYTNDVQLAGAVLAGESAALAQFEQHFISKVPAQVRHVDSAPAFAAEVQQLVRTHLLVAEPGAMPRLSRYEGRGPLAAFVRVAALRIAIDQVRGRRGHDVSIPDVDAWAIGANPEIDYLKARYGPAFRQAFVEALATLEASERALLKLAYCERMTLAELAALEHVHLSTISRRLTASRSKLAEETERLLAMHLKIATSEVSSLVRMVGSGLDASLASLLRTPS